MHHKERVSELTLPLVAIAGPRGMPLVVQVGGNALAAVDSRRADCDAPGDPPVGLRADHRNSRLIPCN